MTVYTGDKTVSVRGLNAIQPTLETRGVSQRVKGLTAYTGDTTVSVRGLNAIQLTLETRRCQSEG